MKVIKLTYPKKYKKLNALELKKEVLKTFDEKLKGKTVINKDSGAKIILSKKGAKHALFARRAGFKKIICVISIDKIIREAKLETIKKSVKEGDLFMMHLISTVNIDNELSQVVVYVRGTNRGKLYYDHVLIK